MNLLTFRQNVGWHVFIPLATLTLLFFSAPSIGHARTNEFSQEEAEKIIQQVAQAGGGGDLLGMVQQLLGVVQSLQSIFGGISSQDPNEPCEGVIIYWWDTPNCKQIKSGLGGGGGSSSGGSTNLQSVLDSFSKVGDLVQQFQQLAGGGGGGGSTGTGGQTTRRSSDSASTPISPSSYDNRFAGNVDQLKDQLKRSVSALGEVSGSLGTGSGAGRIQPTADQLKQLQTITDQVQPIVNNLTGSQYQAAPGSPQRIGGSSGSSYANGLGQKINSLLSRLNPLSNNVDTGGAAGTPRNTTTATSPYTINDIESITARYVDPDSRIADEEYYVYTVNLRNGDTRTVTLPAFAPVESHLSRLTETGYSGSVLAFLALADQTDISFALDDVASITVAELSPLADRQIDDYKEYKITLSSGIKYIVHTHADMTSAEVENNFRNTGYTGDINSLMDQAVTTDKIGDVGFFSYIKYLVFNGVKSVLALFTGDEEDNYTEFPINTTPNHFTGTDKFKAVPTQGEAPLEVTFTISHPNTTLVFGDGNIQTISCDTETDPEDTAPYDLDDVEDIVYAEISLNNDEWHRVYKIKLKSGSVRTAHHWSTESLENMWESFRATGYTGDIQDLRDIANQTQAENFGYETDDNNPNGTCENPVTITHTYESEITYIAKLFEGSMIDCPEGCEAEVEFPVSAELGRISIVVGTAGYDKHFSATPAFGEPSLTVTFYTDYGDHSNYRPSMADGADTLVDFGDGSELLWVQCGVYAKQYGPDEIGMTEAGNNCHFVTNEKGDITNQHTYTEDGTYRVRIIKKPSGMCPVDSDCQKAIPIELATLTIVVGGQMSDPNFTASPTNGDAPLTVYFKSLYGKLAGADAYGINKLTLDFGDGGEPFNLQCAVVDPGPGGYDGHVCTEDARLCPDGSYVGRTGPNCEFAACPSEQNNSAPLACTADAKLCPDGSYVGRTGPNCEFAACPSGSAQNAGCTSDGILYPPGATTNSVTLEDGTSMNVTDAVYVCRGGEWEVSGSYPPEPTPNSILCREPIQTKHTYATKGTYIATVIKWPKVCPNGSGANSFCDGEAIASMPINVGDNVIVNSTNQISFEARALSRRTTGEGATTPTTWTSGSLTLNSGQDLAFRWDASQYESCIPFLADGGTYALSRRGDTKLTTGNTETEGFNINERTGEYRIECSGQKNGEEGVDTKTIQVTVQNDSGYNVGGGGDLNGSGTNF